MKVSADQAACIGAGLCVLRLPEMFDQHDDTGVVVLRQTEPGPAPEDEKAVLEVVELCPARALRVDR
ncbi:ferredoxin [Amycolatopsis sp. cmx-4-61]|uniref:ferredoxin n=1 Tax=Amycolatopsis sp. cmx-4-61 TaxID=2790937 RepID=UPI00397B572D